MRRRCGRSRSSGFSTRGYLTLLDVIVSLCMAQLLDSLSLSFALRSRPESAFAPLQSLREGGCPHLHWSKISTKSQAA